jgi:hypothetical protein
MLFEASGNRGFFYAYFFNFVDGILNPICACIGAELLF